MQHKINIQPVDDTIEPVQNLPDRSDLSELYVRSAEVTKEELQSAQKDASSSNHVPGARRVPLVATLLLMAVGGLVILLLRAYL